MIFLPGSQEKKEEKKEAWLTHTHTQESSSFLPTKKKSFKRDSHAPTKYLQEKNYLQHMQVWHKNVEDRCANKNEFKKKKKKKERKREREREREMSIPHPSMYITNFTRTKSYTRI